MSSNRGILVPVEDPGESHPGAGRLLPSDPRRLEAIVRLLRSRDEHLPAPRGPRFATSAGFVHGAVERRSCEDCLANGFVSRSCESCRGQGFVEVRRASDPYDTGASPGWFGSSAARHERARDRDRELGRLASQTEGPRSAADVLEATRPEGWEVARAQDWARFDYAALDVCLERMRSADVDAYHACHAVFVYRWMPAPDPLVSAPLRALELLDGWLPDPLRAPAEVRSSAVPVPRDAEIVRLVRSGVPSAEVAGRFGLSVSQVNRIAARGGEGA